MSDLLALWESFTPAEEITQRWKVVLVMPRRQRTFHVTAAGPVDAMRKARSKAPVGDWLVQTCQPADQEVAW